MKGGIEKGISCTLEGKLDTTELHHPLQAGQTMRFDNGGTGCRDLEEVIKVFAHSDDVRVTCIRLDEHRCQRVVRQAQNIVALQMEKFRIKNH